MADPDQEIDWSKTTFEGSRREQLRRWCALTLIQRLEALDEMTDLATHFSRKAVQPFDAERSPAPATPTEVRELPPDYSSGKNEIPLPGCTPTPLASYLKALAVLRLVAEAAPEDGGDPEATGFWRNDVFVLCTRLTKDELRAFFLERYRPTPLVAPWGARSGFYSGDSEKTARSALTELKATTSDRLLPFRESIEAVRLLLQAEGFDEKASDEKKLELLNLCRCKLPDELLRWLDACYVLTTDGRKFPPLLGTGGNEGSGSYVSGFAQQVIACVAKRLHDSALASALFAEVFSGTKSDQTPGHFSPHAAGGANATSGFEGGVRTNPWDYLFALEGTLLFASAATRRSEFSPPQISFPFVVAPMAGGSASYMMEEERPKQAKRQVMELWLPLWGRKCGLAEVQALFSEGRATVGARAAENGLDFARSVARLGVDRGIGQFQRYSFLMRNGQSFFATPLERYRVPYQREMDLIVDLDRHGWLTQAQNYARSKNAPNTFRSAAHPLDNALFALTQNTSQEVVQSVLRQIGRIEAVLSLSAKARESVRHPTPLLSPVWAERADDGSAEFQIAVALAGLRVLNEHGHASLHARRHLACVGESRNDDGDRAWEPESHLPVWGPGPIETNLAALLHRRRLEVQSAGEEGEVLASRTGATCADLERFLSRQTDDRRIGELFGGLARVKLSEHKSPHDTSEIALPPAFILLKVFFTAESMLRESGWLSADRSLRLPAEIPARLGANQVEAAVRIAWQRLHALGVKLPGRDPPRVVGADGPRWLAALCIPLSRIEAGRLLRKLDLKPEAEVPSSDETATESTT